jgi:zinc/manganese transport system substrate-binding protein
MPWRRLSAPLLVLALAASGCGREDAAGSADVSVVATTTVAADLVRNVGGDGVSVRSLLQPGADPHDYEPRPSDARALSEADLVVRSGGDLDEWLADLLDSAGGDAARVTLIDHVQEIPDDPHWWQDPGNAEAAVAAIEQALGKADPKGAAHYSRNADAYRARLRRLDRGIERCLAGVPRDERKLVTTHDSFEYFARRYDVQVVGALIPSLSSQAQPSAGEVERLVRQIEDEGVRAIFPENALNPKLEEAVARETGAEVAGTLYADSLGKEGSPGGTYLGALAANARELVAGMSGGTRSCRPV